MKNVVNTIQQEQNKVINEFLNTDYATYLLEGVTGSGKTEVYIRLAKHYLSLGKNVLLLVPEISLTPQMVRRFKSRIDEEIAIFHSSLSNGEKYDEYRRIARKEVRVVDTRGADTAVDLSKYDDKLTSYVSDSIADLRGGNPQKFPPAGDHLLCPGRAGA